ncbi:MAG: ATP-binding cassette domain-containing protein [Gammaproteobacteria bacterium]
MALASASPPLFSCEGVSLDLGGREILRHIGLAIQPGEVLGIIGPNGAGKTSLFEVLSGRIRPKAGTVRFKDEISPNCRCFSAPASASAEPTRPR